MRNTLVSVLKEELRCLAIVTRDKLKLTQREMANLLAFDGDFIRCV